MQYTEGPKTYIIPIEKSEDSVYAVTLPTELKNWFGEKAVVSIGTNYTLRLYTGKQWNGFIDKLRGLSFEEVKKFRGLISITQEAYFEHTLQGERIYLPAILLDYAKIACDEQAEAVLFFKEDVWYIKSFGS